MSLLSRRPSRPVVAALVAVVALLAVGVAVWALGDAPTNDATDSDPSPSDPGGSSASTESSASTDPAGSTPDTPTTGAPTTEALPTPPACDPAVAIAAWPIEARLASLVVVGVDPTGRTDATTAVEDHHVGGVFVGGNDTTLLTGGALTELQDASPLGLVVAVDEEGGRVQRIERIDGDVPSARTMAATMTPSEVEAVARRRARVMAGLGITVDLAPVVDVSDQPARTVIGDRSWSADPTTVVAYAGAYADGLLAEGIVPVLKHFPGHGAASGDTHQGAATTPPLDELTDRDLVPYAELLPRLDTRAAVMLGHLDVPGLTEPDTPASISPATVALLRDDYGFDGVVMTDDLSGMASITDRMTPAQAATRALVAGVDMVLFADADVPALVDALAAAVADGRLTEARVDEAVGRTLALKGVDPCAVDPDR